MPWLIERNNCLPHRWIRVIVQPNGIRTYAAFGLTEDADIAIRFERKDDAEAFMFLHQENCFNCRATEHQFCEVPR